VLKTVIRADETGASAMAEWAIQGNNMKVERRDAGTGKGTGREGWTVTWKGRGWERPFGDYLALVRAGRDLTRAGWLLVVPSVNYHLPRLAEPFREGEYRYTTAQLAYASREPPLLVEKDFSPTLAGDALADDRAQLLRWLREVPGRIRAASRIPGRVAEKHTYARFEDARCGCESVQLNTCFQRPLSEYPATHGSRVQRALHALVFHPRDGLIAVMLEREARGELERQGGELRFLDLRAHAHRAG